MTRRPDITPALFKRLLSHATEEARQRMLAAVPARPTATLSIAGSRRLRTQAGSKTVSQKE